MSNFRSIAPRPDELLVPETVEPVANARTSKIAIACGTCRIRRTKCDGARPVCKACTIRESVCEYAPPTGPLLVQSQKRKIEELENDKTSMYEILWYLQTKAPDKAAALLQHLRNTPGGNMGAILKEFDQDHSDASRDVAADPISPASSTSEILGMPVLMDHPRLSKARKITARTTNIALVSPAQDAATVENLEGPMNMYFNCVGALFYIMNRSDVQTKIEAMVKSGNNRTPLGNFSGNGSSLQLKTYAAELAGMAAIGVVHSQLADPKNAPPAELADYFYAVCKHGLDSAILHNPLGAMKVCALLAMYNIVVKATVALAYAELGLSLARNHGFKPNERPAEWSAAEYTDMRRTLRTLVHLQCWLSASLDYTSHSLATSVQFPAEDPDAPPEDMIRRECVKVTIIKAAILQRISTKAPVAEAVTLDFRARLSTFHSQLPEWMGLGQLLGGSSSELMTQLRPVIFYVHLFYLSAMMLLSRRLIIVHVSLDAVGKIEPPREARQAIEEGYMAAQTNARVMDLMLAEGKVVQVYWLCIFTSYTAGVMIAYIGTQKALHHVPAASDIALLQKCIGVLTYCAQKDALAGRFRDLLMLHLAVLQQHDDTNPPLPPPTSTSTSTAPSPPQMHTLLFTLHPGTSPLHRSARALLRLTHHPFSGMSDFASQTTLSNRAETTMGTHLEWEYELKDREGGCAVFPEPSDFQGPAGGVVDEGEGVVQRQRQRQRQRQGREEVWGVWTPGSWQEGFMGLE